MARARRAVAALAACVTLAAGSSTFVSPARAQGLRTLHVDALAMRVDKPQVHVGETFHLAIHVHVRERVPALDELVVPDVGTMLLLGDERHVAQRPNGTDVIETLTLEPRDAGAYTFPPAYLDAIDARTHRPSRFSSNPVTVLVGGPAPLDAGGATIARGIATAMLAAAGIVVVAGLLIGLGRLRARRERVSVTVAPPLAPPPPPPADGARERVAAALRTYRVAPGNGALTALRAELFAAAAAPEGATLRDALASTPDRALRAALLAAERAAFGPAHVREGASLDLAAATEAWLQ